MKGRATWWSLATWAVAFGLLTLAIVGAWSIGVYVLPFAIVALVVAGSLNRSRPGSLWGAPVGAGSVLMYIAYLNRNYSPCPTSGTVTRLSPGQHTSCGGFDPIPWLLLGALGCFLGVAGYFAWRRRHDVATAT
jgi:hypothetical protein